MVVVKPEHTPGIRLNRQIHNPGPPEILKSLRKLRGEVARRNQLKHRIARRRKRPLQILILFLLRIKRRILEKLHPRRTQIRIQPPCQSRIRFRYAVRQNRCRFVSPLRTVRLEKQPRLLRTRKRRHLFKHRIQLAPLALQLVHVPDNCLCIHPYIGLLLRGERGQDDRSSVS